MFGKKLFRRTAKAVRTGMRNSELPAYSLTVKLGAGGEVSKMIYYGERGNFGFSHIRLPEAQWRPDLRATVRAPLDVASALLPDDEQNTMIIPIGWEPKEKLVPPMPNPVYQHRPIPVRQGLSGYHAIANAETLEEAQEAAKWGMKFGNSEAAGAGLAEFYRRHPELCQEPEPEPLPEMPKDIAEVLLEEGWGQLPFIADLVTA